jgi:UDP-2-acetamido-2,6-beta-L-arabino-hexul-4-ose reductase
MIKIGITGQAGFIGTYLFNTLGLFKEKYDRILFNDSYFEEETDLNNFVKECDVIIHLAAMNRHNDQNVLYKTNVSLVEKVIASCSKMNSKPHIIFASTIQEDRDNLYGKSKKAGRKLLELWAEANQSLFTGLIIPNVFGPYGNPYYNSVIATFCHQLTHNEKPQIDIDGELKLIYVGELAQKILEVIDERFTTLPLKKNVQIILMEHSTTIKVSKLLELLEQYSSQYLLKGEIPKLDSPFRINLFNTFLGYIDHASFFPFKTKLSVDDRGGFAEIIKLNSGGQISFSTTHPGITRGNHYHTRKAERFTVLKGKARIDIRKVGSKEVVSFHLTGNEPSFVDMPIWFTHNITNVSDEDLYTLFWINEHYTADDSDTFFEEV